jgi:uncharacterized delta-60 repeat protein
MKILKFGFCFCLGIVILMIGFSVLLDGCGKVKPEENTTATTPTLPAPSSLTATADTLQVTLSWEAVSSASSYNIYWSNSSGVTNKAIGTKINGVTSPYNHSSLINGQTYYYIVLAVDNASNEGTPSSQVSATPQSIGTLDATFNGNGYYIKNDVAGGNAARGRSITIDSLGKILVTGYSSNISGNDDMVILRYNLDGTLDSTFGSNGIVVNNNAAGGNSADWGNSIAIDSSGRILIAGCSINSTGNYDMVIWRYNSDGTLDNTFGSNGIVVNNNAAGGNSTDWGNSIAIDSSGRTLVAGYSRNVGGNCDMVIWRYNSNGTLDTTFDGDGIVVNNNAAGGNFDDAGNSIAVDSSGRILVAGYSWGASSNSDMAIWRYNSNGTLDTTFDGDGIVVNNNAAGGNSDDVGNSIAIDSSGRILVAGYSWGSGSNNDMVIWRYNSNGTLDTTFDGDGIVVNNNAAGGNSDDIAYSICVDSIGKILVAGYSWNNTGNCDIVVWRYNSNGILDTMFDADGIVTFHIPSGTHDDFARTIATDSSGKILVAGYATYIGGKNDLIVWRYK